MAPSRLTTPRSASLVQLVLLAMLAAGSVLFVAAAVRMLPVTGDNMYPESAGVLSAQRWSNGLPLYEDFRRQPYLTTSFPPLCYVPIAIIASAGISNLDDLMVAGRLWTLLSLAGLLVVAYIWNRRLGLGPQLAAMTPLLYLCFPPLVPWAITARPDFPALLLAISAVYVAGTRAGSGAVIFAAVLSALSFLTRQNSVAVPIALALWWWFGRSRSNAVRFSSVFACIVVSVLAVFEISSGGALMLNLSGSKFGRFAGTYVHDVVIRLLTGPGSGFTILLFVLGGAAWIETRNSLDRRVQLLRIYVVVALALAVLGSGAAGAHVNHFLEPAFALAMLSPHAVEGLVRSWRPSSVHTFAALLVVALLFLSIDTARGRLTHERPEDYRRAANFMADASRFTDIPYVAARSSEPLMVDPPSLLNAEMSGRGDWSLNGVVSSIAEQKFEAVMLSVPVEQIPVPGGLYPRYHRLSADMQSAIREHYRLCRKLGDAFLYLPANRAGACD